MMNVEKNVRMYIDFILSYEIFKKPRYRIMMVQDNKNRNTLENFSA